MTSDDPPTYRIKPPVWKGRTGCCTDSVDTPEGWLGYRSDVGAYVVTGIFGGKWRDDEVFPRGDPEALRKVRLYVESLYYRRVEKWLE